MFKQKGGGVKGELNNVKKLHFSYPEASLIIEWIGMKVKANNDTISRKRFGHLVVEPGLLQYLRICA